MANSYDWKKLGINKDPSTMTCTWHQNVFPFLQYPFIPLPNLTIPFLVRHFPMTNIVLKFGKFIYWNVHDGFDWDEILRYIWMHMKIIKSLGPKVDIIHCHSQCHQTCQIIKTNIVTIGWWNWNCSIETIIVQRQCL